jgi:hypothetical protein
MPLCKPRFLFPLSTFLYSSNNFLKKKKRNFIWDLFHSTTHFEIFNSILTTFWHNMPKMIGNIKLWQLEWNTKDMLVKVGVFKFTHMLHDLVQHLIMNKQIPKLNIHGNLKCFPNLKNAHSKITWNPSFVDVIDNQCKNIKASLGHQ